MIRWTRYRYAPRAPVVESPAEVLAGLLKDGGWLDGVRAGANIGVAVGSRMFEGLLPCVQCICSRLRSRGAEPVIVAAMGSHGGATPSGRRGVLERLGITADSVGAPLDVAGATSWLGPFDGGLPIPFDRRALTLDGLIVINRIKQHTSFRARWESGIVKMLVVGMGHEQGAGQCHRQGVTAFEAYVERAARAILAHAPFLFGIGVLDGPLGRTHSVHIVGPDTLFDQEAALLERARELHPRLPFAELDVLIVDDMGKDISGTGLDTHVIGRRGLPFADQLSGPRIRRIGVLSLTEASAGNATGVGLADLITQRLHDNIDRDGLYRNVLASTFLERARIPVVMPDARALVDAAIRTACVQNPDSVRLVRIRNTRDLGQLFLSEALTTEAASIDDLAPAGEPTAAQFDDNGDFVDVFEPSGTP